MVPCPPVNSTKRGLPTRIAPPKLDFEMQQRKEKKRNWNSLISKISAGA